jgi:DNA-binding CsgD family transcriptional regulator
MAAGTAANTTGRWLVLHASWLSEPQGESQVAIIMEAACPWEIAPVIVQAYELSPREQHIAQWVMRGLSTAEMATTLRISWHTVQDHLKKIFDKVGVHSRRELVAQVFAQHYEPHIQEGRGLSSHDWFTRPR